MVGIMEVYLDNSATTKTDDDVIELMSRVMGEDYGNPSSKHMKGVDAEKYLRMTGEILSGILKVGQKEIIYTSGGTEANNLALIGTALANKRAGKHIISTVFEHESVSEPLKFLEKEGFEITYLPVDNNGHLSPDDIKAALRPDTILVSTMFVNNEIGAVQDVSAIGKLIKEINPDTVYHVDAVQAFGKFEIKPKKQKIDLLSVSAHKIHGPKGVGFLYKNENIKLKPLMLGGGQQRGMRSGTDNVPAVAGLGLAAHNAYACLKEITTRETALKDRLTAGLEAMGGVKINSRKGELSAPHIVSATFTPVKSEVLLHALEEKGIYVSAGSACASNRKRKSETLKAIGLSVPEQDCTLRFSLSKYNTESEIDYTLGVLAGLLPVLSRFVSK